MGSRYFSLYNMFFPLYFSLYIRTNFDFNLKKFLTKKQIFTKNKLKNIKMIKAVYLKSNTWKEGYKLEDKKGLLLLHDSHKSHKRHKSRR